MISVARRPPRREDRAGDPLDGLVNLFDLGIVLSVAFLLAALSSLHLSSAITHQGLKSPVKTIVLQPGQTSSPLPTPGAHVVGTGVQVGTVYQLSNGQLVYVTGKEVNSAPAAGTGAGSSSNGGSGSAGTSSPSGSGSAAGQSRGRGSAPRGGH